MMKLPVQRASSLRQVAKSDAPRVGKGRKSWEDSWLPDMDLNHDKQIQNLLCYRYTIGQ